MPLTDSTNRQTRQCCQFLSPPQQNRAASNLKCNTLPLVRCGE